MFKHIITAGMLSCFATLSPAASFTYTSASVSQLDYYMQHLAGGGFTSPSTDLDFQAGLSIVFEIDERIKKNSTYTKVRISIPNGSSIPAGDVEEFSISTDENRQVVDWVFVYEDRGGPDFFEWNSSPFSERSRGLFEYVDLDCVDRTGDERLCLTDENFGASGGGTWESVAPVPLPASLPLLGAGLLAFGFLRRKNRS